MNVERARGAAVRSESGGPVDETGPVDPTETEILSPESFTLETSDEGSTHVVHTSGEIDILSAPALRAALLPALETAEKVVLDLSEVSFLGSSGLAVLVEARDHAQRSGHHLRLICSSRIVLRALEATGLRDLFDVVTDQPDAG
jgi:anti-anti-sigma factor